MDEVDRRMIIDRCDKGFQIMLKGKLYIKQWRGLQRCMRQYVGQ